MKYFFLDQRFST